MVCNITDRRGPVRMAHHGNGIFCGSVEAFVMNNLLIRLITHRGKSLVRGALHARGRQPSVITRAVGNQLYMPRSFRFTSRGTRGFCQTFS